MNFIPVSVEDIPKRTRGNSKSGELLTSFVAAGIEVALIEIEEGRKIASVRSTLTNYIKTHKLPVKVSTVGEQVYLYNTDLMPEEKIDEVEGEVTEGGEDAPKSRKSRKAASDEAPVEVPAEA